VRRNAALLAVAVLLGGCGGGDGGADETPSVLTGTIEHITVKGRTGVFSLRANGRSYVVHMTRDVDYGFDLRHLLTHRDSGQPVRCHIERRGDMLVALDVLDA
jgi:hypothetical protein